MFEQYEQAVQFEDNLSSHKTQACIEFWRNSNCSQRLYPPDLTHVLQRIDRHIGIRYKTQVYRDVRSSYTENMRDGNRLSKEAIRLSALKKRVLITKAVANVHEQLARSGAFQRSFIATGT